MRFDIAALVASLLFSPGGNAALLQETATAQATPGSVATQIHPRYPADAKANGISGTVTLEATISKDGLVTALRATEGPKELRKEALRAVSLWTFQPLLVNGEPADVSKSIKIKFFQGDSKDTDANGVDLVVGTNQEPIVFTKAYTVKPLPPGRVRISASKAEALLTNKLNPIYPLAAKQAGVTGDVLVIFVIDKSGKVSEIEAVLGAPMFRDAATNAVQQLTYKPYVVGGEPTEIDTSVVVHFQ